MARYMISALLFVALLSSVIEAVLSEHGKTENKVVSRKRRQGEAEAAKLLIEGANTLKELIKENIDEVEVGLEIDNFSRWVLQDAQYYRKRGDISTLPSRVQAGGKEAMVGIKNSLLYGSSGAVSWLVANGHNERIIVMWYVPAIPIPIKDNILAVGIIPDSQAETCWFDRMLDDKGGSYDRASFGATGRSLRWCDEEMCIEGTMGTTPKTGVRISFIPMSVKNLAKNIRKKYILPTRNANKIIGNDTLCARGVRCGIAPSLFVAIATIVTYITA